MVKPHTLHNLELKEKLKVAKVLFDLKSREVNMRKLFNGADGQRLYNLCQLDANFPELNIVARCQLDSDHSAFINIAKIDTRTIVDFNKRVSGVSWEKDTTSPVPDQTDVDFYFDQLMAK